MTTSTENLTDNFQENRRHPVAMGTSLSLGFYSDKGHDDGMNIMSFLTEVALIFARSIFNKNSLLLVKTVLIPETVLICQDCLANYGLRRHGSFSLQGIFLRAQKLAEAC